MTEIRPNIYVWNASIGLNWDTSGEKKMQPIPSHWWGKNNAHYRKCLMAQLMIKPIMFACQVIYVLHLIDYLFTDYLKCKNQRWKKRVRGKLRFHTEFVLNQHLPHHTRSRMSWSTSSSSFFTFHWGCLCCRDTLHMLVMLWYCLFLLVLSSWILSSRGLVLPSNRLRAMETYWGWSASTAKLPPLTLPSSSVQLDSSCFTVSRGFFKSFCSGWSLEEEDFEEEGTQTSPFSSFLFFNSRFQRSLKATSSFAAMSSFKKHAFEVLQSRICNFKFNSSLFQSCCFRRCFVAPTKTKSLFSKNRPMRDKAALYWFR